MGSSAPFSLILCIWGERYGAAHVNQIITGARALSPGLAGVVLVTDRIREGIDPLARQHLIPPPFSDPSYFSHGYRVKLALFAPELLPPGMPCVYLDLDSVVLGDLGQIACLAEQPDRLYMLPPAGLGFSALRRFVDHIRGGRHYPVGNSSVMAFHAGVTHNPARLYREHLAASGNPTAVPGGTTIDDQLISWLAQDIIRAMPADRAVMFRREFLSRVPLWPSLKAMLPWTRRRRAGIVVVTMNGPKVKAETLGALSPGARIEDGRGRRGIWSARAIGALWPLLRQSCQKIRAASLENDT